jgi:hypothetical protein
MELEQFIELYNTKDTIILLEGKRDVLDEDCEKLEKLGNLLASRMPFANFRSGNAPGSDDLFKEGVAAVDPTRFHVIIPDSGHGKRRREGITSYSLDDMQITNEDRVIYESRKYKKTEKLVDRYLSGVRDKTTHYITPIIRDAVKVIGHGAIPPATVALFYDDLSNPEDGGTGFTIKTCRDNGVPFYDQRVWFDWI